jgi:hypothetical protein
MSHFAKVRDGVVTRVIVAEQDFVDSYIDNEPGRWIQTSYNTRGGIHYGPDGQPDGQPAMRGNYASTGFTYDYEFDVFYPPKPFPSWKLNKTIWNWEAPTPKPEGIHDWDEETKSWIPITLPIQE